MGFGRKTIGSIVSGIVSALFLLALPLAVTAQTTTGSVAAGVTVFNANCSGGGCHGANPSAGPASQANLSNAGGHYNYVRGLGMPGPALTATQANDVAAYVAQDFGVTSASNPANVNVPFQAASANIPMVNIRTNTTYTGYTSLTGSGTKGTVVFTNTNAVYTGNACQVGADTVTFQGNRAGGTSNQRFFSVNIQNPAVGPTFSSATTSSAQTGVAFSYTATVSTCPALVTFSLISGPPWLSAAGGGVFSGTPPAADAGTSPTFTVRATYPGGAFTDRVVTVTITLGPPTITSSATATNGAVGIVYPGFTVTAINNPTLFDIASGTFPPGLSLSAGGVVSGTPTASGTFTPTVRATNTTTTRTQVLTFNIAVGVPAITSAPTASGQTGVAFSYQITATNGPPFTGFSLTGTLPAGLTFNTGTGLISGTPTAVGGPTNVTLMASNATGASPPFNLAITITLGPPVITSSGTASGGVAVAFTPYQIAATNSPTSFNATGLPPGLTVDTVTGIISGTPTGTGGLFNVTISATNNVPLTGTANLAITIALNRPVMVQNGPANGQTGVPFTFQLMALNGPDTFQNLQPLPGGLTLAPTTGLITGTPTAVGSSIVNFNATNGAGASLVSVPITFNITLGPPVITSPNTAGGAAGFSFSYQIVATNNPTLYGATGLPPGVTLNTATGLISGTPTANGVFSATVSATNATATTSLPVTITIAFGVPVVTSANTASGSTGQPFSYQITATNSPTSFNATGLPPGVSVNTATGLITGVPGASGSFAATVSASNATGTGTQVVTISISLTVPAITSTTTLGGTTGVPLSYQITGTNNPTSFGATGLPPGLKIDTATGIISGTPTAGGTYTTTVSATNAAGAGSTVVTFTIVFVAPTVKDIAVTVPFQTPTAITLPITGQFTTITIVTLPDHGILSTPAAGSAVITYTPAMGFAGEDRFTYSVTGPGGISTVATVTITVPTFAPEVMAVTMTVELNTPKTVDLAPFIKGSGVTGVSIPKAAIHGSVAVNGTKVTYTPKHNFFGADSFTYMAFGNAGTSAPGLVTVNVIGRPDPTQDPTVVGLLDAQAQTAKRFSRAQISNYQRRLETLHVGPAPSSGPQPNASGPGSAPDPKPATSQAPGKPEGAGSALPGEARASDASAKTPNPVGASAVGSLMGLATSHTINLNASSDGGGKSSAQGTNVWIGGTANFGTRSATDDSSQSRFSTDGVTVGADRRFSDKLAIGMGIGYARDRTEIGLDGSRSKADGTSFAGYGSYHPTRDTFVDWMLGYGVLNFDSDRFVESVDEFATGRRKGRQFFGSLAAGYERRWMDMLVSPYGRLDFSFDKLRQSTETGAGLNALTYLDQTQRTTSLAAGLRVESRHEADFGIVAPRARLEYRHDFESGRGASIQYADGFAGLTYSVTPTGTSRNFLVLGLGVDFQMRRGLTFGIDYQGQRSSGASSSQAIRFQLTQELDGPGLPSLGWTSLPFTNPVRVEGGFTFDDNVSRGRESDEKLSDRNYSLNIGLDKVYFPSKYTKAVATALVSVDKFHRYTGLGRFSVGAQGELQYRSSGEFDATTYAISGRALYDKFESDLRTGSHYSLGLNARRSLTDRIDIFGEVARNIRYGRSAVFDLKDYSAKFNLDYSLGAKGAFYFSGEYRKGDLFSSGRGSLVNLAISDVFVLDDAFPGGDFFAYRLDGRSVLGTVGYNYPLGPRDAIDFSWRRVQSTPSIHPGFDFSGSLRYIDNQYSIVYLMRF